MNFTADRDETRKTLIIPVEHDRFYKRYTIEVSEELWNHFQAAVVLGGEVHNTNIFFELKPDASAGPTNVHAEGSNERA